MQRVIIVVLTCWFASGCRSPYWTDRAAVLGGLLGAGVGSVVGNSSGNTTAGAVIGTAVGATAGAVVGAGIDDRQAEQASQAAIAVDPLLLPDVLTLSKAGLSDTVIINEIRSRGTGIPLAAAELISLKQQGVSDRVIEALQAPPAPPAIQKQQTVIVDSPPVVSIEPQVVIPIGPRRPGRGRHGWSFGVGF